MSAGWARLARQVSHRAALSSLGARNCNISLEAFARLIWPVVNPGRKLRWSWHMSAMCEHLEAWLSGAVQNLIINLPPGHSKSFLVSVAAPTWAWIQRPHLRFIGASYDMKLSTKNNMLRRTVVTSSRYRKFLKVDIERAPGEWNKTIFTNSERGFMQAVSTATGVTGDHADFMIIDDPITPKGVWGPELKGHVEWLDETASSRFGDLATACVCIVMQRIHVEDMSGVLLKREPERWCHLNLPAEFVEEKRCTTAIGWEDPRTVEGELLCADRFPTHVLEAMKVRFGSGGGLGWFAQYQQDPAAGGGRMFNSEWWQRWEGLPEFNGLPGKVDQWVASIDAAFGESGKDAGDWNVTLIVARIGNKAYVITEERARAEFSEFLTFLFGPLNAGGESRTRDGFADRWIEVPTWHIELAANGASIASALRARMPRTCTIKTIQPKDSKQARAAAKAPLVESGHVLLPADAPWAEAFIEEAAKFPNTKHNDRIDALTQALDFFGNSIGISAFVPTVAQLPSAAAVAFKKWGGKGQAR